MPQMLHFEKLSFKENKLCKTFVGKNVYWPKHHET